MGRAKVGLNDIQSPQVLQLLRMQANPWIKEQLAARTDAWFPTVLKSKHLICPEEKEKRSLFFQKQSRISNGFSCSTTGIDLSVHNATSIFGKAQMEPIE